MKSLESRIGLFIIKSKMSRDLMKRRMENRLREIRRVLGEKLAMVDPYGEEEWDK